MLKDLAEIIAKMVGKKVVFEIPDHIEADGYSTAAKARLNGRKLQGPGWKAKIFQFVLTLKGKGL